MRGTLVPQRMLFNSYVFIFLFLPIALAGFFILGRTGRRGPALTWLFVASLGSASAVAQDAKPTFSKDAANKKPRHSFEPGVFVWCMAWR